MTGNWSAAEEVVSLTFLEAWRLREEVRPAGESLRPWLPGIAVNVEPTACREQEEGGRTTAARPEQKRFR